jgi:citrate lyase gamma subunit
MGTTLNPTRSDIGLIINDQAYRLQKSSGESETVEILLRPQSEYLIYLTVESIVGVQFSEEFEMQITVK